MGQETKHTPGPGETKLRLNDAAPELLEACKRAELAIESVMSLIPRQLDKSEVVQQALSTLFAVRIAIAKAEGRGE